MKQAGLLRLLPAALVAAGSTAAIAPAESGSASVAVALAVAVVAEAPPSWKWSRWTLLYSPRHYHYRPTRPPPLPRQTRRLPAPVCCVPSGTSADLPQCVPHYSTGSSETITELVLSRAISYYKRAAEQGDKRAIQRLKASQTQVMHQPGGPGSVLNRGNGDDSTKNAKDKECVIM